MEGVDIDGSTGLLGIIGHPVKHSLSPTMHNAAFRHVGLNLAYLAFEVERDRLGGAVEAVRELGILGANVTIPHKSAVMRYLDSIEGQAEEIGAVNTIMNKKGVLTGYNTDAPGAMDAIIRSGHFESAPERVLLIGAGDAARAVGYGLCRSGSEVGILNRDPSRARGLADRLSRFGHAYTVSFDELEEAASVASLIVNCTPLGMAGFPPGPPIEGGLIRPQSVVFDIVYDPLQTSLLRAARSRGARVIPGAEMLVWQGARSFEIWTGREAPVTVMRASVLDRLRGRARSMGDS